MAQKRKQRDLPAEAAELPEQKKRKKPRKSNQDRKEELSLLRVQAEREVNIKPGP